jgi:DNA ligase-associated metallophosphoesterase
VAAELAGEAVVLLGQRALWWPAASTLFVADVHLGKAATFRRFGVALPRGSCEESLSRLTAALTISGASRLVVLGDLLHSRWAQRPGVLDLFGRWRADWTALKVLLVRGNHDGHAGDPPPGLGVEAVDAPLAMPPFAGCHEPGRVAGLHVLAGHVHPAVRLSGGVESMRLPCFWSSDGCTVLPSFGAFTGSHVVRPKRSDRVFVVADGQVLPMGGAVRPPPCVPTHTA